MLALLSILSKLRLLHAAQACEMPVLAIFELIHVVGNDESTLFIRVKISATESRFGFPSSLLRMISIERDIIMITMFVKTYHVFDLDVIAIPQ
jgi:hypothetical protein